MNTKQRPVFQAVMKYRYPATAIVSVLHRISGVVLFLLIPLLLWAMSVSLTSADGFERIQTALSRPIPITLLWITLLALLFHLVAGIRHMIMDLGYGESLRAGKRGAYLVVLLTIILLLLAGMWL